MSDVNSEMIETLREALVHSPDNLPLRRQLGRMLLGRGELAEAERVYRGGLEIAPESEVLKLGLASCFHRLGKASAALVIVEDLVSRPNPDPEASLLQARLLAARGDTRGAGRAYARAVAANPNLEDAELAAATDSPGPSGGADEEEDQTPDFEDGLIDASGRIRVLATPDPDDDDEDLDPERPEGGFEDVGGMDDVKQQVRMRIIEPMRHAEMFAAYGKAVGGGVLMYGPPGCGKTHLARATAGEVDAAFISIGIHDVLDMYLGNSEGKLHALFEGARSHAPCVLFFDEVDALGAKRTDLRGSAGRTLVNQFLAELDGVKKSNDGVLILAATNAPWHVDAAFRRPGRFDRVLFVPPPDEPGRAAILRVLLRGKPQEAIDAEAVARKTKGYSGADLKAVVDTAVEAKLSDAIASGVPRPLVTKDLIRAVKRVKPTTAEWFATAKNHAMYANEGGTYDDVLEYLKGR